MRNTHYFIFALLLPVASAFASGWGTPNVSGLQASAEAAAAGIIQAAQNGTPRQVRPNQSLRPFSLVPDNGWPGQQVSLTVNSQYEAYAGTQRQLLHVKEVMVDWGDGSAVAKAPGGASLTHAYGDGVGAATTYRGKVTFVTDAARYTEPFTYKLWVSTQTAQEGDVAGRRLMPDTPVSAVTCGTWIGGGTCQPFSPVAATLSLTSWRQTCHHGCGDTDEHRNGLIGIKDLAIDFYNHSVKLKYYYYSSYAGSTSSPSEVLNYSSWEALGTAGVSAHASWESGNYPHSYSFAFNFPAFSKGLLDGICQDKNPSTIDVVSSNEGVVAVASCSTHWQVSLSNSLTNARGQNTLGYWNNDLWLLGNVTFKLHWRPTPQPTSPNLPTGGARDSNVPAEVYTGDMPN